MGSFLMYDSPAQHPRISVEEREYIEKALNTKADEKVRSTSLESILGPGNGYPMATDVVVVVVVVVVAVAVIRFSRY